MTNKELKDYLTKNWFPFKYGDKDIKRIRVRNFTKDINRMSEPELDRFISLTSPDKELWFLLKKYTNLIFKMGSKLDKPLLKR